MYSSILQKAYDDMIETEDRFHKLEKEYYSIPTWRLIKLFNKWNQVTVAYQAKETARYRYYSLFGS